ncbi:putative major envelope protein [Selenomonas ruminantium subsp. lactilytica TAM6421]|uniref:Putative major envelope protein n=1 Tax=Selenomonas ruminantium subsp. lactilytica (strain NBRC 103574 / TAM6421) TaxID=927704 RepID=I0GM94_SELRL|nr:putative porin [Selenomonas ruminantium]BAL81881.1 putative major envelope protein [Selenomonas ruminantium subsp. lactilytica TAM6421]
MKKTLVSALTTALVVGAASTTFAASNPFSDVPADHWAYDAVSQLAADGVIEGYGDSTFKGNRNITRYEMAQMVAKAMAKNTSGADKALVDKLAAEFAEELNNLGVRVSNLERNADKVKWTGEARYTYVSDRLTDNWTGWAGKHVEKYKTNSDTVLFRLEPSAEVNNHWSVKARLDASTNMQSDKGAGSKEDKDKVTLARVWAQGNYNNFQVKLGKFASYNNDTFADTEFSGAEVAVGKKVKGILGAGRLSSTPLKNSSWYGPWASYPDTANYQYLGVEAKAKSLSGAIYWHRINSEDAAWVIDGRTANIFGLKAAYKFDKNLGVKAFYNFDNKDLQQDEGFSNGEKKAGSIELNYKGAQKENKGTWGAWVAYRHLGGAAIVKSTYDAILPGFKGWEIGANYTLFKNVVATARYGDSKIISPKYNGSDKIKEKILFGRVQFFF